MSYHIYTTEGIILKRRNVGEADSVFSVFTKDFGRVEMKAQGVRYLKSKLRYHLSGKAILRISFVDTNNDYYRLTDAEELRIFENVRPHVLLNLLERLVQGQQKDKRLWQDLVRSVMVSDNDEVSVLRFLEHLGYAGATVEDALAQSML